MTPNNPRPVCGRYAPSPTGALHLGNLRTALASWLNARSQGGSFYLRIDDLDGPRCRKEYEQSQLRDLERLGLDWDIAPIRQSERVERYRECLAELDRRRLIYPCFCSRKDIQEALSAPHAPASGAYPGTCESLPREEALDRVTAGQRHCWRLRVTGAPPRFFDGFQGEVSLDLSVDGGDFVVARADGQIAYQLACAVDDGELGITEVLRGGDLLDSAARQAWLISALNPSIPKYLHIPLMLGEDGRRLAKREGDDDLTAVMAAGADITAVVSYLAWTLGALERGERATLRDIMPRWDLFQIPRNPVHFSWEDLKAFV